MWELRRPRVFYSHKENKTVIRRRTTQFLMGKIFEQLTSKIRHASGQPSREKMTTIIGH